MVTVGYPRRCWSPQRRWPRRSSSRRSRARPLARARPSTFDQCANGAPPSTSTSLPGELDQRILNSANSHYAEDDVHVAARDPRAAEERSGDRAHGRDLSSPARRGARVRLPRDLGPRRRARTAARTSAPRTASRAPRPYPPDPLDPTVVADNLGGGTRPGAPARRPGLHPVRRNPHGVSAYCRCPTRRAARAYYAHVTLTYSVPSTADGAKVILLFGRTSPRASGRAAGRRRGRRLDLGRPLPRPHHGRRRRVGRQP